jgi:hypothetical protein
LGLEGVVVRAGTDQGLAGQQVGLWPTSQSARTNPIGRFEFRPAPGDYELVVVHEGIVTRVPITWTGRRAETVRIEAKSPPAISGTVFNAAGERAAAARVQAFRRVHSPAGVRLIPVMSVLTDDAGDYRLYRLRPGGYYIAASLTDRDRRAGAGGLRLTPHLTPLDSGTALTFFPHTYAALEAQRIDLRPGNDVTGVRFFLRDQVLPALTGELISGQGPACARIAVVPEGSLLNPLTDFTESACGSFHVRDLSPGNYVIVAAGPGVASEPVRVSVRSENVEVRVSLSPTANLTGRVFPERPASVPLGARVVLVRTGIELEQRFETVVNRDGTFALLDIPAGTFDVLMEALPAGAFVESIRHRGADGLTRPIRVDRPPPSPLEIQLGSSSLVVEGVAVDRLGRPLPGAEVVLVPGVRNPVGNLRADRYLKTIADVTGAFRITGVPPGSYAAFAFEQIEPGAYYAFSYQPQLLSSYLIRGVRIELQRDSRRELKLLAVPWEETVGGLR